MFEIREHLGQNLPLFCKISQNFLMRKFKRGDLRLELSTVSKKESTGSTVRFVDQTKSTKQVNMLGLEFSDLRFMRGNQEFCDRFVCLEELKKK
jgi:hypothetical protein